MAVIHRQGPRSKLTARFVPGTGWPSARAPAVEVRSSAGDGDDTGRQVEENKHSQMSRAGGLPCRHSDQLLLGFVDQGRCYGIGQVVYHTGKTRLFV